MGSSRLAQWGDVGTLNRGLAEELARIANAAKPKLLVLYHQLFWGATDEDLVREVRRGYAGAVISGRDLDVFPGTDSSARSR